MGIAMVDFFKKRVRVQWCMQHLSVNPAIFSLKICTYFFCIFVNHNDCSVEQQKQKTDFNLS